MEKSVVDYLLRGEIRIQGSWNSYTAPYPGIAWKATLEFMEKGQIDYKSMVSHKIQLEELSTYLNMMFNQVIKHNKILIEVNT